MSEVVARGSASRGGRGSARGGRGGYSSRGGRGSSTKSAKSVMEDQGEIGQLKSKYADSVKTVKEIFPQFTDEDVVVALEENGGDLETTINKISSGAVSQWEEAAKKKDKPKTSKPAESGGGEAHHASSKSGRGRGGSDNARGGRARTSERGRGAGRGGKSTPGTSTTKTTSTAIAEPGWEVVQDATEINDVEFTESSTPSTWDVAGSTQAAQKNNSVPTATAESDKPTAKSNGTTRSWADLMKPAPKPKQAPAEKLATSPTTQIRDAPAVPAVSDERSDGAKLAVPSTEPIEQVPPSTSPSLPPSEPAAHITPSDDKLTEENLEQVKDVSHPVETDTVASTIGTEDPRSVAGTPLHSRQAASKQPTGGFATTALKATQGGSRASSFHRKLKEQSEAVVMPGNHAVDRTAVQFGSLGLGGSADDVDDDREEPETRTQPPQHSPIAPRASLPIASQQGPIDSAPTPRAAPGLTADPAQAIQADTQPVSQSQGTYDQFSNRLGGLPSSQPPGMANVSKPYEPFGQQLAGAASHPFDSYAAQSQAPGQQSQTAPSYLAGFGGNDYGSYNEYQRNPQLYGGFGQHPGQSTAETAAATHRAASGFGSSAADPPSQYSTSHPPQNRFGAAGDALNSGHSTPAPSTTQPGQTQGHTQGQHLGGHTQAGGHGPYASYYGGAYNNAFYNQQMANPSHHQPYGRDRPAFDDARRYDDSYMSQNHHYGYGGYGTYGTGPYGGKYGGPNQYGISPQTSYDAHSASPANAFGRDSGHAGFGSYGRAGSAHPESAQQSQHGSSTTYGGMADAFGRNSAFTGQGSQQQGQQASNEESSRFVADSSKIPPGGPSPAPNQQRPGSATNNVQTNPGAQPPGQQSYSGYPHSGLGGFGGGHHQAGAGGHHTGYSGYGGGFGAPYYGGGRGNTWGYGTS